MFRSLEWIAAATEGETYIEGLTADDLPDGVDVGLATTDSRECVAGSLYFARVGETSDGHSYLHQAADAGAVVHRAAALAAAQKHRPRCQCGSSAPKRAC